MRVLHILNDWGSGGVETNLLNYCDVFQKHEIVVDIFLRKKSGDLFDKQFLSYGGHIYTADSTGKFPLKQRRKMVQLLQIIEEKDYALIHINGGAGDSFIFARIIKKKYPSKKIIMHCHATNLGPYAGKKSKFFDWYGKRYCSGSVDYCIACSEQAGNWLYSEKIRKTEKYGKVNYSIATEEYRFQTRSREEIRKELGITERFVIGTVGRLSNQKNPLFLLEVFAEVCKKNGNAILLWIGTGEKLEECISYAEELKIRGKVIFYGISKNIPFMLAAMDVFLLPSFFEGNPIALIEAQSSGLVCVISDAITPEANVTDLIFRKKLTDSPGSWADEIIKHFDDYKRRNTTDEIRAAGFDKTENAERIAAIYQKLLKEGKNDEKYRK